MAEGGLLQRRMYGSDDDQRIHRGLFGLQNPPAQRHHPGGLVAVQQCHQRTAATAIAAGQPQAGRAAEIAQESLGIGATQRRLRIVDDAQHTHRSHSTRGRLARLCSR
jgi:hypothetical protein